MWDIELLERRRVKGHVRREGRRGPPVMLITSSARQQTVARCCVMAGALGVRRGMTLAEARALCPHARVYEFDRQRSLQSMEQLAKWANRFSPVVAVDRMASSREKGEL